MIKVFYPPEYLLIINVFDLCIAHRRRFELLDIVKSMYPDHAVGYNSGYLLVYREV